MRSMFHLLVKESIKTFVKVNVEKLKYFGKTDLTDVPATMWYGVNGIY